jgi:transposase
MELNRELMQCNGSRYIQRLYALLLATIGLTPAEIGLALGKSPHTITNWINHYNKSGLKGLETNEPPGRIPRITDELLRQLAIDVRRHPSNFGYDSPEWDGGLLARHIKKYYRIELGIRQIQRILKLIGFTKRRPKGIR